jgi:glyoxylase-like metal-dependent hydrolase (beta-lactamase superfamily II)
MEPAFAINQRPLLLQSPAGNVLWDCVSLVTDEAVAEIKRRGGLTAIAISHPHYYTAMLEWSAAFGGVPVYLHADDRQWVMRPGPEIVHWTGETLALNSEMTLIRCGGHFPGGQVLHWSRAEGGRGALMTGDIVMVVLDRRYVSFMYSFPNYIPLNAAAVHAIAAALAPYAFGSIYGGWTNQKIIGGAKAAVASSVERYVKAIGVTEPEISA